MEIKNTNYTPLGKFLLKLGIDASLSREETEEAMRIRPGTLSHIEKDKRHDYFKRKVVNFIKNLAGVDQDKLCTELDEIMNDPDSIELDISTLSKAGKELAYEFQEQLDSIGEDTIAKLMSILVSDEKTRLAGIKRLFMTTS